MTTPPRRLHVGILCDYGFTYLPTEGIGVFVYNLVDGLLALPEPPQITLQIHPGDARLLRERAAAWGGRVRLHPHGGRLLLRGAAALSNLVAWGHRTLHQALQGATSRVTDSGVAFVRGQLRALRDPARPAAARTLRAALLAAAVMAIALPAWLLAAAYYLVTQFLLPVLGYPHRYVGHLYRFVADHVPPPAFAPAPGVDVWLVPHGRTEVRLNAPEVLVIFDLVHHHLPGVFTPEVAERTDRLFAARARRAAFVYCALEHVRTHDLERFLPFARDRIRSFPLAAPPDRGGGLDVPGEARLRRVYALGERYLYYPSAFRHSKNHRGLLRAFAALRREALHDDLVLVLTGPDTGSEAMRDLVLSVDEELLSHVRLLGIVTRGEVVALFRHTEAVVLPSLHEGYGLPLVEALCQGAPLCCSDIPAFRELLGEQFGRVESFDPRDHRAIARAVRRTLAGRERLRESQALAFAAVGRRTWAEVAADFMELFAEAAAMPCESIPDAEAVAHA